jgi:hypothetical protein
MARRRTPDPSTHPAIPPNLYAGLVPGAFPYTPDDAARTGKSLSAHRDWSAAVHAAGYTVDGLREAARSDLGYQMHLRGLLRARLLANDPGLTSGF